MPLEDSVRLTDNFGQVTCDAGWLWDTRHQPLTDFDLWYVWDGEGELVLNGTAYALAGGSCFLFRPGDRTAASHHPEKPLTVSYIHFEDESGQVPVLGPYRTIRDTYLFETLISRYMHARIDRSFDYDREGRLLLVLLLHQLQREEDFAKQEGGERMDRIYETANYIRQYPELRHSVVDLAERAGLSPRYFARKFRTALSMNVQDYVIQTRIRRAEHLLRHGNLTVAEVAERLGYQNVFFFSRQFKKFRGLSPSAIKKGI